VLLTGNNASLPAKFLGPKWWYVNYPEHVVFPSKKYYQDLSGFELVKYIKTFASRSHEKGSGMINTLKHVFDPDYSGRSSFSDHHLVVLRKL
jgi:hypothetical protein